MMSSVRLALTSLFAIAACHDRVISPFHSMTGAGGGRRASPHTGVDIAAGWGDPVLASAPGRVIWSGFQPYTGWIVIIEHGVAGGFLYTRYVHLRTVDVGRGDHVERGDKLGTVGFFENSGHQAHVHLEVCVHYLCADSPSHPGLVDPMSFSVGCFAAGKRYPQDHLVLTYPVRC